MRCGSRTRRQRPHVVSAPLTPVRPPRTVTRRLNSSTLAARRAPSSQSRGPQHPTALIPFGLPLERSPILPINRRAVLTNKVESNFSSPKVSVQKLSFRIGAFETVCCDPWRVNGGATVNKPEPVKIEVTTRTITHTIVSGKWHFYTSTESKLCRAANPLRKESNSMSTETNAVDPVKSWTPEQNATIDGLQQELGWSRVQAIHKLRQGEKAGKTPAQILAEATAPKTKPAAKAAAKPKTKKEPQAEAERKGGKYKKEM